jgi:hypothetical protein
MSFQTYCRMDQQNLVLLRNTIMRFFQDRKTRVAPPFQLYSEPRHLIQIIRIFAPAVRFSQYWNSKRYGWNDANIPGL